MWDKIRNSENFDLWIFPIIILLLSIILFFLAPILGFIGLISGIYGGYYLYNSEKKRSQNIRNYLEQLDVSFDEITKTAIFNMPFPLMVINNMGKLIWYNGQFKSIIGGKDSLLNRYLDEFFIEINYDSFKDKKVKYQEIKYSDRNYILYHNYIKDSKKGDLVLLYAIDNTQQMELKESYINEGLVMMSIHIDNYDEVYSQTESEKRPIVFAEIDRLITSYIHNYKGFVKKYESDRYNVVLQKKDLEEIIKDKFKIVDKVRDVSLGNKMPPTLSIGVGINEPTVRATEKSANAALDIALGRGGDQVVIRDGDELEYYGGKNKATEKRTKVKARVIAHALSQLIEKSADVFVMGHKNPDMDSFGSALGLVYASRKKGTKTYLVLDTVTPAIRNIYNRSVKEIDGLEDLILTPAEAYDKIENTSLIIVTDNHRKNSTEAPRLFEKTDNVVVIDHHRRGKDYIEDATLVYMEPYASSASELVTEMLMYMEDKVEIHPVVAEGLLAGITVDTKNFFYQTGVRTFEAASVLKRQGADSIMVKQLFKDDFEIMKYKSEIISEAKVYFDRMIIGQFDREIEGSTLIASQAADDLLNIQGIDASFVLAKSNGKIHISGRSLGDVSVQLILERIGGGGHLTAAATQLDLDMDKAKEMLIKAIEEYIKEEEENEGNIT